jgi:hypothetical protein
MKTYVAITGVIFGLVGIAHIWRMFVEPPLATDPAYLALTALAALLAIWAGRIIWSGRSA